MHGLHSKPIYCLFVRACQAPAVVPSSPAGSDEPDLTISYPIESGAQSNIGLGGTSRGVAQS